MDESIKMDDLAMVTREITAGDFNDFTCQSWLKMTMHIERDIAKRIRRIHQRLKDRCY